jgi:hypothetical protein
LIAKRYATFFRSPSTSGEAQKKVFPLSTYIIKKSFFFAVRGWKKNFSSSPHAEQTQSGDARELRPPPKFDSTLRLGGTAVFRFN